MNKHNWPLMSNDIITKEQREVMAEFILSGKKLTYGDEIKKFEEQFCEWNGSRYSIFVNSGSSANLALVYALKLLHGDCYFLTNSLTWATNISPVIMCGHDLQMVDVDLSNLGVDLNELEKFLQTKTSKQKVLFLTHVLGFNAVSVKLLSLCKAYDCILLEDCCESAATKYGNIKVGNIGLGGTFSGFYGHTFTTIEGGLITTNDEEIYRTCLLLRSHGLTRELPLHLRPHYEGIDPKFTFEIPGMNIRSVELHALLGQMQLKDLDKHIEIRNRNLRFFLENCPEWIKTDYDLEGVSSFALPIILNDNSYRKQLIEVMEKLKIEYRPLISGSMFKQPFIQPIKMIRRDKKVESIHKSFYIGNHQHLEIAQIKELTDALNKIN